MFSISLVGDAGVGKTSIAEYFFEKAESR